MKYCTNCGRELEEGAKTCGYCGVAIQGVSEIASNTNQSIDNSSTTVNKQNVSTQQTNGLAVAGFVVSLVSFLCCCGGISIVSLILSIVGLTQSKKINDSGKGLAIAGIIISAIGIIISVVFGIIYGIAIVDEMS